MYMHMELTSRYQKHDSWQDRGACLGAGHLFFDSYRESKKTKEIRIKAARAICSACPVFNECEDWAHSHVETGIWAGETAEERHARGYTAQLT